MDQRLSDVAQQLLLIERELRALGWWQAEAPSETDLASTAPFCVDTLAFEQWLQWVLLPRMKELIERDQPLPTASGILAMGEVAYREQLEQVGSLLKVLAEFDRLLAPEV